jgi:hypothetical protein
MKLLTHLMVSEEFAHMNEQDVYDAFSNAGINVVGYTTDNLVRHVARVVDEGVKLRVAEWKRSASVVWNGTDGMPYMSGISYWLEASHIFNSSTLNAPYVISVMSNYSTLKSWIRQPFDWSDNVTADEISKQFMYADYAHFLLTLEDFANVYGTRAPFNMFARYERTIQTFNLIIAQPCNRWELTKVMLEIAQTQRVLQTTKRVAPPLSV